MSRNKKLEQKQKKPTILQQRKPPNFDAPRTKAHTHGQTRLCIGL